MAVFLGASVNLTLPGAPSVSAGECPWEQVRRDSPESGSPHRLSEVIARAVASGLRLSTSLDAAGDVGYLLGMPLWARLLVLFVACLLVGFAPLAYADPPDPLFIAGFWDDDDFDKIVVYILGSYDVPLTSSTEIVPLWLPIAHVRLPDLDVVPTPARSAVSSRAPPVASVPSA